MTQEQTNSDIKFAKPEDITQIIALAYKNFQENELEGLGCDTDFEKITLFITDLVFNQVVLVQRNAKDNRLVDGLIALKTGTAWWSNEVTLNNAMMYIKPEHRSFKTARALLNASKEYAIMNRLPIVFELFAQKDVAKKKKLLQYLGFKELGTFFVFDGRPKT